MKRAAKGSDPVEIVDRQHLRYFVVIPGLLDGAASVPLVLLAAATGHAPVWDRLFLLS